MHKVGVIDCGITEFNARRFEKTSFELAFDAAKLKPGAPLKAVSGEHRDRPVTGFVSQPAE